jgi:tight adherence protein B
VNSALLTVLAFLAIVLGVIGVYSLLTDLFLRDRSRLNQRMEETFRIHKREEIRKAALFKNLPRQADRQLRLPSWRERFLAVIEQSALGITARQVLLWMVLAGLVGGLAGGLAAGLLRRGPLSGLWYRPREALLPALLVGAASAWLPFGYVLYRRNARLNRLLNQLPDAFDLMSRILRSGQSVPQSMQAVADEFDQPIAGEFGFCYEQQNLGLSNELAMRDLARRTGLLEIKILTLAMLVQQETGGNLAELLDRLAGMIRERVRLRGKIAALTAEGRTQAAILLVLPLGLLVLLMVMSPVYAEAVFDNPWVVITMLVSEGIGALWIRQIVNFDF